MKWEWVNPKMVPLSFRAGQKHKVFSTSLKRTMANLLMKSSHNEVICLLQYVFENVICQMLCFLLWINRQIQRIICTLNHKVLKLYEICSQEKGTVHCFFNIYRYNLSWTALQTCFSNIHYWYIQKYFIKGFTYRLETSVYVFLNLSLPNT